jgi:hypothetical protein
MQWYDGGGGGWTVGRLEKSEFIAWPILEHSKDREAPLVYCENPSCQRNAGPNPDAAIFDATYRYHVSASDKEVQHETKRRAREHWNTHLLPQAKYVLVLDQCAALRCVALLKLTPMYYCLFVVLRSNKSLPITQLRMRNKYVA